jgi:hypothetical protein
MKHNGQGKHPVSTTAEAIFFTGKQCQQSYLNVKSAFPEIQIKQEFSRFEFFFPNSVEKRKEM